MSFGVGGTGLPDRSYYLTEGERFEDIRNAYVAHIAEMFTLAGIEGGDEKSSSYPCIRN